MYERDKPITDKPTADQADATSAVPQETATWTEETGKEKPSPGSSLAEVAGDLISAGIPAQEHIAAMRDHGQALLEHMQAQSMLDRPEREQTWSGYMTMVQDVLHYIDCAGLVVPPQQEGAVPLREMQAFGRLVRERREAAGLSRSMVAQRAKLSDATIKFIETAKTIPSRTTLFRLLRVTELGLSWADVPAARQPQDFVAVRAPAPSDPPKGIEVVDPALNFYVPPSYDAVRMIGELARLLNGAGGHVEQTSAYLDHHSAAAYLAMCRQWPIAAAPRPLDTAARKVCQASGDAPLTVIALGAGDGTTEVQFVRHLVACCSSRPDIELCLMDISQPLLTVAYKHAADTLTDQAGVHVWCLQGNFHHLPTYPQLQYKPSTSRRRRVYCAFGGTLANIDHEPRFFRDSLASVCGPGDFLVMDVQLARGNVDEPASIHENDPALLTPFPKLYSEWLSGPIYRCCPDVASVDFSMRLDTQCPVPGSYAVEAIATVRANQRSTRQFSMFRFKRYELARLSECMKRLGWEPLLSLPFGVGSEKSACLLLFVRVAD